MNGKARLKVLQSGSVCSSTMTTKDNVGEKKVMLLNISEKLVQLSLETHQKENEKIAKSIVVDFSAGMLLHQSMNMQRTSKNHSKNAMVVASQNGSTSPKANNHMVVEQEQVQLQPPSPSWVSHFCVTLVSQLRHEITSFLMFLDVKVNYFDLHKITFIHKNSLQKDPNPYKLCMDRVLYEITYW